MAMIILFLHICCCPPALLPNVLKSPVSISDDGQQSSSLFRYTSTPWTPRLEHNFHWFSLQYLTPIRSKTYIVNMRFGNVPSILIVASRYLAQCTTQLVTTWTKDEERSVASHNLPLYPAGSLLTACTSKRGYWSALHQLVPVSYS